jgi:hypothetical protein
LDDEALEDSVPHEARQSAVCVRGLSAFNPLAQLRQGDVDKPLMGDSKAVVHVLLETVFNIVDRPLTVVLETVALNADDLNLEAGLEDD